MLKMYDYPRCPYCRKVRVALAEKKIPYEREILDLRQKEQKREEFLRINPYGKVPAIVDGDAVIYESSVINEYLEEKYPNPRLMPQDPAARARARILIDFCENHFHPAWFNVYRELALKTERERSSETVERSKNDLTIHLERLNRELEGREYLAGDYSLADIAFTPRIATFDGLGIEVSPELTNVRAWIERIKSRASYSALEL